MTSAYLTIPEAFILKDVRICSADDRETNEFNTYDNIKIVFEMEFPEKIENVLLAINIRDQVDDVVISSSKLQLNTRPCEGTLTTVCEIRENKLREGNYNIGFYVSDFDGGSLYKSHCVGSFTILADMEIIEKSDSILGFMVMETTWEVNE